nr:helix-turn-helix transcriptional regulator [Actinorugispora endophytica]
MQEDKGRWGRIGGHIRFHRKRAGLSQSDLAGRVLLSATMLSAMERGVRGIKREYLDRIDSALGTGGALADLWDRTLDSGLPAWCRRVVDVEQAASEIRTYHPLLVPGLLQTEEYARHVLLVSRPKDTAAEIDVLVREHMRRQAVLDRERPPRLLVVLEEGVLRRPTGGRELMRRQLGRLLEACDHPGTAIQVVPYESEHHPGLSNAFTLFTVPGKETVLHVETRRPGAPTSDPETVDDHVELFGDLRGAALPLRTSRRLVAEALGGSP